VADKPLIQYAVEECVASGIENVILVTGRGKNAIEDHFDSAPELERFLEERGRKDLAELVRQTSNMVHFSYVRQKEPLGLGDAVRTANELVGDEPFAVLLGDVIIAGAKPATRQLIEVFEATGLPTIAVEPVPRDQIHLYGVVQAEPLPAPARPAGGGQAGAGDPRWGERLLRVRNLVEKPRPEEAPSNLAVTGRYVLPPEIFDCLERTPAGRGGEIQLTDALRMLAQQAGLLAYVYEGKSYDAGDKLGFLRATVEMALKNPELGEEFRAYLRSLKL